MTASYSLIQSSDRATKIGQPLLFHRDYARGSNDDILVDLPSQSVPKVEVGEMQIRIDHNLALPDAGQKDVGVVPEIRIGVSPSSDCIWYRQSYDTDGHI